ncbi:hypothetical protein CBP36_17505 [Acidovorax carolinensis]|uniref:Glycosyltransferase subfamily 4-like N-terminal domain-containing protein n=1 Tax=Acidovorax carolinensis TaxID=553814 RepID=A0A240UFU6_9BURK|nr:glycosyltransferase [Acidovorax carolinensis]ART60374.1 hypothetical protein CBP36_17505 [Acidovorax carolinensis]
MSGQQRRRRIVHVVDSFAVGGLENVIVQPINRLLAERFEHVVLSLTIMSDFKQCITQPDVRFIELHKPAGHAAALFPHIYKLLRKLQPDVVHSCNLAGLKIAPLSWLARVPLRFHAEHGWEAHDPKGQNPRYRRLRKLYKPSARHYVAVSKDWDEYLAQAIGAPARRRSLIADGADAHTFAPSPCGVAQGVPGCPFAAGQHWMVGTVGRLQTVKKQRTPEVVEEGNTGLLVPSDDADAMAQAVWRLYADAASARRFAQSARRQAVKSFGIAAMVHSYERLFSGQRLDESVDIVPGYSGQS